MWEARGRQEMAENSTQIVRLTIEYDGSGVEYTTRSAMTSNHRNLSLEETQRVRSIAQSKG